MSIVATGTLALVDERNGKLTIEHWNQGGEISYTITGGELRDVTPYGDKREHYRWTGKFRRQGRTLQIGFMQGVGLPGVPDPARILQSAFEDAASVEYDAFDYWAAELGYETEDDDDQRKAKRIYNACERMRDRLERFFPNSADRERWAEALSEVGR